ncbi:MAG: hypothetical protein JWR89_1841 [Tardiphaga sp.]|jgi:hypothetical protein|uniref:hypothetical protein n=1 Tax=Tardiphaga sp. TaxID=1926292 RepID=UPI002614B071|nr:hypothetical protein [Tardiphaga sp.]MDB5501939.1 hypothetical protein [Tardiphaga sp.]
MSDWMTSGADAPYSRSTTVFHKDRRRRRGWRKFGVAAMGMAVLSLLPLAHSAFARDRGQFAATSPELKSWFDSLRSGKGPCCSDADGSAVSDVDWESSSGHYKVRLEGTWFDVPDEAVITGPNRVGRTMVWPMQGAGGITIRCFMPGSMT